MQPTRRNKAGDTPFILISVLLHATLALIAMRIIPGMAGAQKSMILSIETISGSVPLGEGSGSKGQEHNITNQPANPSPLANGVHLRPDEAQLKPHPAARAARAVRVAQPVSAADLDKEHNKFPIGLDPSTKRQGEELSQGGLGDNRQAGTANGAPSITGAIASRGYHYVDWEFPSNLPEESTLVITIVVAPSGLVKSAQLTRASGYPEIDQNAISKAKSLIFDPLPSGADQVDMAGVLTFTLQYKH